MKVAKLYYWGIGVILIGILFRIMHWPYGTMITVLGFCALIVLYAIHFFRKEQRIPLDYIKLGVVVSFGLRGVFITKHWPYSDTLTILTGLFLLIYLVMKATEDFRLNNEAYNTVKIVGYYALVIVGATSLVGGIISKIMHWYGASVMLIVGLVCAFLWFAIDILFKKE